MARRVGPYVSAHRLVDVDAAAVAAGVKVRTIYRWISQGWLHPVQNSPIMLRLDEIDEVRAMRLRVALVKRLTS
jgi:predicted site-specific integrase-resolvase